MEVPYQERNISIDPESKRQFVDKGYDLLPVIEAGSTVILEYTGEPQLIETLAKEGYL